MFQEGKTLISCSVILGLADQSEVDGTLGSKSWLGAKQFQVYSVLGWGLYQRRPKLTLHFSLFKFAVLKLGLMLKLVFGGEKREICICLEILLVIVSIKVRVTIRHQVQVILALYGATVAS